MTPIVLISTVIDARAIIGRRRQDTARKQLLLSVQSTRAIKASIRPISLALHTGSERGMCVHGPTMHLPVAHIFSIGTTNVGAPDELPAEQLLQLVARFVGQRRHAN